MTGKKFFLLFLHCQTEVRLKQGTNGSGGSVQVEVVGFSALAANADTSDCILMLNRIFSVFDQILDLHGVHKVRRPSVALLLDDCLGTTTVLFPYLSWESSFGLCSRASCTMQAQLWWTVPLVAHKRNNGPRHCMLDLHDAEVRRWPQVLKFLNLIFFFNFV